MAPNALLSFAPGFDNCEVYGINWLKLKFKECHDH